MPAILPGRVALFFPLGFVLFLFVLASHLIDQPNLLLNPRFLLCIFLAINGNLVVELRILRLPVQLLKLNQLTPGLCRQARGYLRAEQAATLRRRLIHTVRKQLAHVINHRMIRRPAKQLPVLIIPLLALWLLAILHNLIYVILLNLILARLLLLRALIQKAVESVRILKDIDLRLLQIILLHAQVLMNCLVQLVGEAVVTFPGINFQ